jgi:hypothetical protein
LKEHIQIEFEIQNILFHLIKIVTGTKAKGNPYNKNMFAYVRIQHLISNLFYSCANIFTNLPFSLTNLQTFLFFEMVEKLFISNFT